MSIFPTIIMDKVRKEGNTVPASQIRRVSLPVAMLLLVAIGLASCGNAESSGADGDSAKLTLVSYSTPREALQKLILAFTKTDDGSGVSFSESYGASGDQSRAVEGGLAADVVSFSLAPDMTRLVEAGLVSPDWSSGKHKGMVTNSVVVFVVRKGNPKNINDWQDLVKRGTDVVTPNPFTSGGARWNLMAGYGAILQSGKSKEDALKYLEKLLRNTPVQSKSAREALQVFTSGEGDVMLAYENEALLAQKNGEDIEFVIPDSTILIENPVAVVSKSKHKRQAQAFLDYLLSASGQRIYAKAGYRPVDESVAADFDFHTPEELFTIEDLGGWNSVMDEFFDKEKGSILKIEQKLNVPTS